MNISLPDVDSCTFGVLNQSLFSIWFSVYLLFLPLFLFVLYIGFNKWKKPQSSASGGLSHSDVVTLHMVTMEMSCIVGSWLNFYGLIHRNHFALSLGRSTAIATSTGQVLFHSLTCVERYLAVVHPVTYLRLRGEGGVTVRNISIALVWLFCVGYCLLILLTGNREVFISLSFVLSISPLPLVSYCSIYVICVLIHPKPGERGGLRKQIDQSKRSTVYTMAAILGALLLRLIADALYNIILFMPWMKVNRCAWEFLSLWSTLPSSLVLPLLFLHRAGKLTGWNQN